MIYPQNPRPTDALPDTVSFSVDITSVGKNSEQRTLRSHKPLRTFNVQYGSLSFDDVSVLMGFYMDCNGPCRSFTFIHPVSCRYRSVYVGKQTGSGVVFDLSVVSSSAVVVYVNGVQTDVAVSASAGVDGRDRITFSIPPALGALITADFTGYLAVKARFASDYKRTLKSINADSSVDLVEVP